jgi:phage shock protein E
MSFLSRLFGGAQSASHPRIQPAEYKSRFIDGKEAHTLVDVRTPDEFKSGHLVGSINIAVQELNARLNKIPKGKPVVVYCHSGSRSSQAAKTLLAAGYTDIYDLGSLSGCTRQGLPMKR